MQPPQPIENGGIGMRKAKVVAEPCPCECGGGCGKEWTGQAGWWWWFNETPAIAVGRDVIIDAMCAECYGKEQH